MEEEGEHTAVYTGYMNSNRMIKSEVTILNYNYVYIYVLHDVTFSQSF